ncbi:hypothetical protein BUALT_Bualt03G0160900 [Buddleja alternifolia]|uniref:DUF8204 domain-containing protein n=1 Tax=Buddleja alternifolia TaxID=168488 RepID=A0AAV6XVC3_9LAMI|nr:hypothetical protein BUALT_Bualt03G0160900 [Buddleja alternifolia]
METSKEGRSLIDFRYGCIGYSLYVDRKEQSSNGQETQTKLPVCVGLEVLVDRRVIAVDSAFAPMTHIHREGGGGRYVNAYSTDDWMLGIAFRFSQGLSGIQPVDVPGIENVNGI